MGDSSASMAEWAEAVVYDLLKFAYDHRFGGREQFAAPLARQHTTVWRLMLEGRMQAAQTARQDLNLLAMAVRLNLATLDTFDWQALNEIVDVVSARFRHSPDALRAYNRKLVTLAAALTELKHACAPAPETRLAAAA
ncbi:MAG: hypothetical protein KGL46_11580 [Hyphomicrobiales bacterium]|nr:hypothetical protein [Hyphomicrobiales bacterium]